MNIDEMIQKILEYRPDSDPRFLRTVYVFAQKAYGGKKNKVGVPRIQAAVEVASCLVDLNPDLYSVAAAMLYDMPRLTDVTWEQIRREFGIETEHLAYQASRLMDIFKGGIEEKKVEGLRKLILAMSDDVRVVIIKLAEKMCLMRTLGAYPELEQKELAEETMRIFAPLANRLGIWSVKRELEDLSFRYLEPAEYEEIVSLVSEKQELREESVEKIAAELELKIKKSGIKAQVSWRPKHIYSIYNKMKSTHKDLSKIYDVIGIRVVVGSIEDCYAALDLVNRLWDPVEGEFDDYIAAPKSNLYRSLHTAVVGPDQNALEIQIRTQKMHETAEFGVAAHWRYKESVRYDSSIEAKIAFFRGLLEWQQEVVQDQEDSGHLEGSYPVKHLYVLTPKGDVVDLPEGSTPIDFAYSIHTEIGHRCQGAKVNGKLVSLDYKLQNGDRVEILTAKRGIPSRDWLNPRLKYVITHRARRDIRNWFQTQERLNNISRGREILDRELKRSGVKKKDFEKVSHLFNFARAEDFLEAVGRGQIRPSQVKSKLEEKELRKDEQEMAVIGLPSTATPRVSVKGMQEFLTRIARCCNPLPGNEIVGFITCGRGISIHRRDCHNIRRQQDSQRLIRVEWGQDSPLYSVPVYVVGSDSKSLLKEMAAIVEAEKANIISSSVNKSGDDQLYIIIATLEIASVSQMDRILKKIKSLPDVLEVRRLVS